MSRGLFEKQHESEMDQGTINKTKDCFPCIVDSDKEEFFEHELQWVSEFLNKILEDPSDDDDDLDEQVSLPREQDEDADDEYSSEKSSDYEWSSESEKEDLTIKKLHVPCEKDDELVGQEIVCKESELLGQQLTFVDVQECNGNWEEVMRRDLEVFRNFFDKYKRDNKDILEKQAKERMNSMKSIFVWGEI
ncbi:Hypothetical predicted protein [Pelobates cultripes]|uniref:Uncharacterized protein n=1 Tax=Pelobates cultripes TaxID=61616 RepID=A0AAD1RXF3_PELCU|nr:Hypothetical predicted protein [Pelobates cultripes]